MKKVNELLLDILIKMFPSIPELLEEGLEFWPAITFLDDFS